MLCIQLESLVCVWSPHLQSTGSIQPLHIATTLSNEADHWLLTSLTCSKLLITDPTMKGTCPSLLFKIYLTWFLCFTHPMLRQSVGNLLYTKEASYFYIPVLYTVPILWGCPCSQEKICHHLNHRVSWIPLLRSHCWLICCEGYVVDASFILDYVGWMLYHCASHCTWLRVTQTE